MRHALLVTTAIVSVSLAAPALAQEAAPTSSDNSVADIVVTAQKRTEKLQEIPVAAAVLTADAVAQQHVTDLSDINHVVPSVEIKGTFNGRVPYGIRGISTNANEGAIGLTSGVSIQVDGVPVPADSFAANTVSDVSSLEVLKGPQATLGGRTASAGVINFVTYSPTRTTQGGFSATITDDGEARVDAHVSGPITDTIGFSIAGFDSRTPYPVYNLTLNQKSRGDQRGIRGKLKFEPSDAFDITLMGHYALATSRGENFVPVYFTSGAALFPFIPSEFNGPGGSPSFFGIRQATAYPGFTIQYGNTDYASPVAMGSRYEDIDGSVVANLKLGDLTLTSTSALFKENQFQSQDIFESNVYFFDILTGGHAPHFGNIQTADGEVRQFTQEFKLASDPSKPVNFLVGAYYSNMTVDQTGLRVWVGNPAAKRNVSNTKNYALYGRATFKASDQFSMTAGLRYNHDKIGWNLDEYFNPAAGQFYNCNPNFDAAAGTGVPTGCSFAFTDSSNTVVGDVSLQFHPSRDTMAYVSYTRGYKPRAFNTVHDFSSFQTGPIYLPSQAALTAAQVTAAQNAYATDLLFHKPAEKETIDSFEAGLKTSLLDRHMTFNLAAFYTNYKNYQAQIFDTSQVIGVLVLANAGASTRGVEADLNYVNANTRLSLSAAYIDAKFKDFPAATCYPTQTAAQGCAAGVQNLSGKPMPASPKFKVNASVQQTVPLSSFNVLLGGNLSYRSSTMLQANQNPQTNQPAFALLDLSLGFQTKDEKASLTFFVNNVTNHFYYTNMEDFFSGATGFGPPGPTFVPANMVIGQPARDAHRYFGGRVAFKF
ncbi:MAG: TonB-dependent receptor [Proteobacteria bacterium]|nr:TonB-dependent receptor [Pseudomonadota bacterium]